MRKIKYAIIGSILCFFSMIMGVFVVNNVTASAEDEEMSSSYTLEELSEELFGNIKYSDYLYNFDDSVDYIYICFEDGGYAILYKNTLELLEYSRQGEGPYKSENEMKYYGGPNCYYRKTGEYFQNVKTGEYTHLSVEDNLLLSQSMRTIFLEDESEPLVQIEIAELNGRSITIDTVPKITIGGLIPATEEGCIDNFQYFLADPTHGDNEHNTCGSVASQLLLSYHNYYTDRRIIAPEHLNGGWNNAVEDGDIYNRDNYLTPNDNLNACINSNVKTKEILGSNDIYYEYVINAIEPGGLDCRDTFVTNALGELEIIHSHNGSTVSDVENGLNTILSQRLNSNMFSVTSGSASSDIILSELQAERPVIILMQESLGGYDHWVLGYGYQEYTYEVIQNTYSGYVVHFGGDESETSIWVNSAWCSNYVAVQFSHEHNYNVVVDGNVEGFYKELRCGECGHRTLETVNTTNIGTNEIRIDSINYTINSMLNVPTEINGRTVTAIGEAAFANQMQITEVVIPNTVLSIGEGAFENCSSLTTITGMGEVVTIGANAFKGCTLLTTLPNNLKVDYIGISAFDETPIMNSTSTFITIGKVLCKYNGTASILNEIDFPLEITRIASYAFSECESLQTIYLSPSILNIDDYAFDGCGNLITIRYLNSILPSIGSNSFVNVPTNFKFYCRKDLIDNVTSSSNWYLYRSLMSPVTTQAYFIDLDMYVNFYYGQNISIPTETIEGKYIKGWQRIDEETNEPYGDYLSPLEWEEIIPSIRLKADTMILESYSLCFYNGADLVGAFTIQIGDTYEIDKEGYTLNGEYRSFAGSAGLSNCAYNSYYGPSVVNGVEIATFEGWLLDDDYITGGQWFEYYSDDEIYIYADWQPIFFTAKLYNGYGGVETVQFNYCDGLILSTPTRADYIFKGWKNNATGVIVSSPVRATTTISLTAQWNRLYNIIYNNLTFGSQTAFVVTTSGNVAPTQYEYGKAFSLTNIIAVAPGASPYKPYLNFIGWYTSSSFTTKVTNISATQTGAVEVYAKWRYDYTYATRASTYTITDSGRFNQLYDTIGLDSTTVNEDLKDVSIKYLFINIKLKIWEVNDGYQHIFLYDGTGTGANLLWQSESIRHGGDDPVGTPAVYEMRILIPIEELKNVSTLCIRFGASGNFEDNWCNAQLYYEMMYVVEGSETAIFNDLKTTPFHWTADPYAGTTTIKVEEKTD